MPSAENLSSLEFAGSPGLEPGLQKEVGLFRGVRQSPACPPGGALPTQRGARPAGRGSSPEVLPEIKAQPASQTHLQALAVSSPSDFQSEPAREAAWGACP